MNRRDFLRKTTAAGAAVVLPLSMPLQASRVLYIVEASSHILWIDALGDKTDLISVPTFSLPLETEGDRKMFWEIVNEDDSLKQCSIWFVYAPNGRTARAAVSKTMWPNARLLIDYEPPLPKQIIKRITLS